MDLQCMKWEWIEIGKDICARLYCSISYWSYSDERPIDTNSVSSKQLWARDRLHYCLRLQHCHSLCRRNRCQYTVRTLSDLHDCCRELIIIRYLATLGDHHRFYSRVNLLTTREAAWYIILVVSVRVSVCMSVCLSDDKFRKPWRRKFIFAHAVYLHGLQEPKGSKIPIPAM